ncbi:hypothetical protein BU14_0229s0007 [Porphyra umbilicalis]|uniref:Uncharacterized protein n=1 Tax=Porphyra umbilicalis TaxID=2786 RepID=A0A1X6P406_PORUM|nr:hypothetical protein BU14_0229s0007 [Porphyra umbilicalis]|eukprot:OSX75619.1 hypothetical protein BU14_0229s0007 [Porphyra umbilicalis]
MTLNVACNAGAHVASGHARVAMSQKAVDWFNKQSNAPFDTDPKHLADRSKLLTDQCERENKVCKSHSSKENELERSELTELLVGAVRATEMWLQANECGDEATYQKEARLRQQEGRAQARLRGPASRPRGAPDASRERIARDGAGADVTRCVLGCRGGGIIGCTALGDHVPDDGAGALHRQA